MNDAMLDHPSARALSARAMPTSLLPRATTRWLERHARRLSCAAMPALLGLALYLAGGCVVGDQADEGFDPSRGDVVPDGFAPAYYESVDASDPQRLRQTLHEAIDDHRWYEYTSSSAIDIWDILEHAQEDPRDAGRIIDIYHNASFRKWTTGNTDYDREHTWPKSFGFTKNIKYNYPYTDAHHLMLADGDYNSERSNKPYGTCTQPCDEWATVANGDYDGSTPDDPGLSNWTRGYFSDGVWEVWRGRRGDVARAMFYMDVRYEGGVHGVTGRMEPDLMLTDDLGLIVTNTTQNLQVAYMGHLSTLLAWHRQDPVSDEERHRNDVVAAYQGNRNPFIDHPEWVGCVFESSCDQPAITPWINELHYDNVSTDVDEGVEIAGAAGTDLSGWSLALYNGSGGVLYRSVNLAGVLPDEQAGLGALWVPIPGLQNGAPDGLALIDSGGAVVQVLGYEGAFAPTEGPALGLEVTDIGVAEDTSTALGTSLQLTGTGCAYADFDWSANVTRSPDRLNEAQTLSCP